MTTAFSFRIDIQCRDHESVKHNEGLAEGRWSRLRLQNRELAIVDAAQATPSKHPALIVVISRQVQPASRYRSRHTARTGCYTPMMQRVARPELQAGA